MYMCECLLVCMCTMYLVSSENRRGHLTPWIWCHIVTMSAINPLHSPEGVSSALKC